MGSVLGEETLPSYFFPALNIWCLWEDRHVEMNLTGETVTESVGVRLSAGTEIALFCVVSTPVLSFTQPPLL
jgi:hypothetical protein